MTKDELEALRASGETSWLDWKKDFSNSLVKGTGDRDYEKGRGTLLKDLVSIANGADEQYGYLVYGVQDEGTTRLVTGTSKSWDDADFQTWARNTFDPVPKFVYSEFSWSATKTVAVFRIERVPEYPHVVVRSVGGVLFDGQVCFRQGTQNRVAHLAELQSMILGEKPFIVSSSEDTELLRTLGYGQQLCWPRFEDKDSRLESGYQIVYYPGTRREVLVNRHGQPEVIAMLKPRT